MHANFYFDLQHWLFSIMFNSVRLFPLFMLLPYLNQSMLTGLFKFVLAFLLGATLCHSSAEAIWQLEIIEFLGLIIKEIVIGLIIAVFLCLPFWTLHAVGSLIDNQRGATLSSTLSPLSGIDTSELAHLFNLLSVAIVLEAGGILTMLQTVKKSYQLWPPLSILLPELEKITAFTGQLMKYTMQLSAPVVTIFLISELSLGLLARYAPQMNAFSLSLSLKTLIGFMILLLYFPLSFPGEILRLKAISSTLH